MYEIPSAELEPLEKSIYSRDYETAGKQLVRVLRLLKIGAQFKGYPPEPRLMGILYTRLCAAIVSLYADPGFNLSQTGFEQLAAEHAVTDLLFRASAFLTSDHVLPIISANPDEADRSKLKLDNGAQLVKFLLTYSLRSGFALNFEPTFKRDPQQMFALWAGMVSTLLATAVSAEERREKLIGLHGIFRGVKLNDAVLPTLSDAYMYSTYGLRRDKHDAKATICALFNEMLRDRKVKLPTAREIHERRDLTLGRQRWQAGVAHKPTMLICCEWFSSLHAMFRCYAPIVRQLRTKFRLVGMSRASDIDEAGKAEFDEWREVPGENLILAGLINEITLEVKPDVIYYPSIGMAMWWVVLASARLAPIQMMSIGHPASSRSPYIDYALCDEGSIGDPSLWSERIVEYPNGSCRFVMRGDASFPEPFVEDHPETVRIAVPAMLCKLNATFMRALKRISDEAGRPVEFHCFVNMLGINLYQAAREIRDWLPTALIYERMHYNKYLDHLNRCHLHCSTFPFGGTNSVVDSLLIGLPVVSLWGDEPHERCDGMMTRRAGLPESLVAKTHDEYVAEAVRLVKDDAARNALRDQLRGSDLQAVFFDPPPDDQRTAFVDLAWDLYLNHEQRRKPR